VDDLTRELCGLVLALTIYVSVRSLAVVLRMWRDL
jgi:hypothetical protein